MADWQVKRLGDVCTLQRGFDLPTQDRRPGAYPLVSSSGIVDAHDVGRVQGPGVVTGRSGSIGNVFYVEEDFWPLNTALYVRDFHNNDPRFVYYLLTALDLRRYAGGTGVPTLNRNDVHNVGVMVPDSVQEQRRIVAILDEAFEGIATAKANSEKNMQNARELFDSRRRQVFSAAGDDWAQVLLGEACSIARGGSPRPIKEFLTSEPDGVSWVKISDATASAKYIFTTAEKIKAAGVSRSRLVHDGDFLLSNSMSFGRPYIMRTTGCIHDGWLVLSNYQKTFDQDFLYLVLGSTFVYQQFDRLAAGSTVRNLNIELASSVRVPAPPLEAQIAMAAELEELSGAIDQLFNSCQQKAAVLDELKKSFLHQAFTGHLTTRSTDQQLAEVA